MFIAGKKSLPVPVGCRDPIMQVLHRRSGESTDRAQNMLLLTKKEIYIRGMELGATASRAINGIMEVKVGRKSAELCTLFPIKNRV